MHLSNKDILELKSLVDSNRIITHNLAYNNIPTDEKISMLNIYDDRKSVIIDILFKYYKENFFNM